ncbi:MAG TPA: ribosome maturation factor RimM [Bacillota bacterium]|nr:ribosome maturation factor RimM [Bacillota bacterium]
MEKLYDVGKIVNTHGVKGEVRVIRITDFEERFTPGNTLYIVGKKGEPIPVTVKSHRTHKQFDLLTFEKLTSIDRVEKYKDSLLKVAASDLTPLVEGEFYYHEIIGCTVESEEGENIGQITSILSPGANDVWVVETEEGKEVLIPYIKDVVKEVNIDEKRIRIHLMEGLID